MLLIALTNTCAPDVIYFHVWAECLQTADSDDADAAAASDLLVYLIRESVTDDFVLRLLPLLNKSQTDKLLPVVHEIIGRVSDDSTGVLFSPCSLKYGRVGNVKVSSVCWRWERQLLYN